MSDRIELTFNPDLTIFCAKCGDLLPLETSGYWAECRKPRVCRDCKGIKLNQLVNRMISEEAKCRLAYRVGAEITL